MKMIYCTCNISMLEELRELIEKCKIQNYQAIEQVTAMNSKGEARLNTPVWPGFNASVFIQLEDPDQLEKLFREIGEFNSKVITEDELIFACSWNIERVVNG
jgi:hypothetical protein